MNRLFLKVLEAYTRDVGRGVARMDHNSMDTLGASAGDVIEIKGKKGRTVAKCLPLYPSDEDKEIIRIDGLGRNNSGVEMGDTIMVRKIKAAAAERVVVEPLESAPPIDGRYMADSLESVPLVKGDYIMVPYFGGRITFRVMSVAPASDAVQVGKNTEFSIVAGGEGPAMIVSTYPDMDAASKAATDLVRDGLAACVNVSEVSSFYSWEGKLMTGEREQIAIFKTTLSRKEDLKEAISRTHPYDVPEIAEISVSDINGPYMRWLACSTGGGRQ